jgi:putative DNA methylase
VGIGANDPNLTLPTANYRIARVHLAVTLAASLALTTFSDLVDEVRANALKDASAAGVNFNATPLHSAGTGAAAYADAVATYLAFAVSKSSTRSCSLAIWETGMGRLAGAMGRQALGISWTFRRN